MKESRGESLPYVFYAAVEATLAKAPLLAALDVETANLSGAVAGDETMFSWCGDS